MNKNEQQVDIITKIILGTVRHTDFYNYSQLWSDIPALLFQSSQFELLLNSFNLKSEAMRIGTRDVLENFSILFNGKNYLDFRVVSTNLIDTYEVTIFTRS